MKTYHTGILLLSLSIYVTADIAPTTYDISNISAIDTKDVSMETADVHITWDDPCRAKAVFTMINHTDETQKIHVGFPLILEIDDHAKHNYAVSFNGSKTERLGRSKYTKAKAELTLLEESQICRTEVGPNSYWYDHSLLDEMTDDESVDVEWFGKVLEFPLGKSEIIVTYDIPLSWTYRLPYRRKVNYILHTGSKWKGNIKRETVTFYFPSRGLDPRQLDGEISPPPHSVNSNSITWCFTDFEPTKDDDISVEFIDPRAFENLKDVEAYYQRFPSSRTARMAVVKHYFALGPHKGCGSWLPDSFSKKEFDEIVTATENQADAAFLQKCSTSSHNKIRLNANEDERRRIYELMYEVYVPSSAHSVYVDKAKLILEDHLASLPEDADAWLIYLHNYYRFSFCGYPYGRTAKQKAVIEKAIGHCPTDEILRLWKKEFENEVEFDNFFGDNGEHLIGITSGAFPDIRE